MTVIVGQYREATVEVEAADRGEAEREARELVNANMVDWSTAATEIQDVQGDE